MKLRQARKILRSNRDHRRKTVLDAKARVWKVIRRDPRRRLAMIRLLVFRPPTIGELTVAFRRLGRAAEASARAIDAIAGAFRRVADISWSEP